MNINFLYVLVNRFPQILKGPILVSEGSTCINLMQSVLKSTHIRELFQVMLQVNGKMFLVPKLAS